jgi:hypothetical protein
MASDQREKNRQVQKALRDHGDPITEPCEIDLWAYFGNEATRNAFIERCQRLALDLRSTLSPTERNPVFGARLYHVAVPRGASFERLTEELARLAQELGGNCDGWETMVIEEPRGLKALWSELKH